MITILISTMRKLKNYLRLLLAPPENEQKTYTYSTSQHKNLIAAFYEI